MTLAECPDVLTADQFMALLQIKKSAFWRWVKAGRLPDTLPLPTPRWSKADVARWLSDRTARRGMRRAS